MANLKTFHSIGQMTFGSFGQPFFSISSELYLLAESLAEFQNQWTSKHILGVDASHDTCESLFMYSNRTVCAVSFYRVNTLA